MAGAPRKRGPAGPLTAAEDGVRLAVHVTPRSGRNRIEGVGPGADGRPRLRVSVTAPPEDGKANAAVIALLARAWRMPKRAFSVRIGAAAREKLLHVAGEAETLLPALAERIGETDG